MAQGKMKQKTCQDSAQPESTPVQAVKFHPAKSSKGARPKGKTQA